MRQSDLTSVLAFFIRSSLVQRWKPTQRIVSALKEAGISLFRICQKQDSVKSCVAAQRPVFHAGPCCQWVRRGFNSRRRLIRWKAVRYIWAAAFASRHTTSGAATARGSHVLLVAYYGSIWISEQFSLRFSRHSPNSILNHSISSMKFSRTGTLWRTRLKVP
jgi:hypothetical protein